jgi:hypothetical protein
MSDPIIIKKSETDFAVVSLGNDRIIRVMFKKKCEVNQELFRKLFEVFKAMIHGVPYAYIYYAEDSSTTVTDDGRRFAKEEEYSFPKICNAVIVTNLAHKLIANFYLKFNKPNHPFKIFSKMEDAEKWCRQQQRKATTV